MNVRKTYGFTLVELLVVIAIIGVLSLIGMFAFTGSMRRGRDNRRKQDLTSIAKALELYANDFSTYPLSTPNGSILGCGSDGKSACTWGEAFSKGSGTTATVYMAILPKDPTANTTYAYEYSSGTKGYYLYAVLESSDDPRIEATGKNLCGSIPCNYVQRSPNIPPPTPTP